MIKYLFFSLRPKQWFKNLFIFLPLIFGKRLFDLNIVIETAAAFFLFSLASGVVYLINDIIDIENDKIHPIKKFRPIASGKVSIQQAIVTALILGAASITLSLLLNVYFGALVIVYIIFNFAYSKVLKEFVIIDVFCLGAFFLLRIIAGIVVTGVGFSHWMVFMTVLLALFLGFNKRRQELKTLQRKANFHRHVLLRYNAYFIDQMIAVITSSIVIAYMLYTVDAKTVRTFGSSHLMYSIPFVYYGIFRYLYLIHKKGKMGDPTRILLSDRKLQINIVLWALACIAVIYFRF